MIGWDSNNVYLQVNRNALQLNGYNEKKLERVSTSFIFGQDKEMPHHMNLKTKHFFLLLQDGLETTH